MKVLTQMAILLFCIAMFSGITLAQVNTKYEQANEQVNEYVTEQTADGSKMLVNKEYYTQVAEDTDIMATIIDKTMKKIFNDEYRESGFFDAGCQGIFLKGYGVLFTMNVGFPVVKLPEDSPVKETKPDNLWDQTKRELKEGSFAYTYGSPAPDYIIDTNPTSYDQKKVEQLKDELLRLIGEYSNNIRNLQPNDNVSIIIRGDGKFNFDFFQPNTMRFDVPPRVQRMRGSSSDLSVTMPSAKVGIVPAVPEQTNIPVIKEAQSRISSDYIVPASPSPPDTGASTGVSAMEISPQVPSVATMTTRAQMLSSAVGNAIGQIGANIGQKGSRSTMIITVKKRNVTDLKEGRINSDEFAKRAEIIQY